MAQQNIDYGSFPNDPQADAIRIAFEKVQSNFTELYGNLGNIAGNVSAITAGPGIVTNISTGNVTVTSVFSSLTVHSDSIGVSGLGGFVPPGGISDQDYTVNSATNTLFLELNSNYSPAFNNVTIDGNLSVDGDSLILSNANIEMANGNIVLSNGSFTGKILSLGGPGSVQYADDFNIVTGDTNFVYHAANTTLSVVGGNIVTDTIQSQYLIETVNLTVSNVANITNLATVGQLISLGNIHGVNGEFTGNLIISGNVDVSSVTVDETVTANLFSGSGLEISDINASNITSGIIDSMIMSGTYDISITGSAETSATVTASVQSNITEVGVLNNLTVGGIISTNDIVSVGTIDGSLANFTNTVVVNQLSSNGNVSGTNANFTGTVFGNNSEYLGTITANELTVNSSITGSTVTVTGDITTENLSAGGNILSQQLTVTGETLLTDVIGQNFDTADIVSSGSITAVEFIGNQATVVGNIFAGNVFANAGTLRSHSATISGLLQSVNGIFTGNVNAGNLSVADVATANDLTVNNTITSQNIDNSAQIQTDVIVANTINANSSTILETASMAVIQLTGLTGDPVGAQPGQLYYNTVTGTFRGYNGVAGQWQNLN